MFKRCALAQLVPFLVMIPLGLLLALIGPRIIRHFESRAANAPASPAK